ncbi:MAG: oligosaccharide flippase family protein [Verrucomicrobiae bacterium]|nr:oligosaccharide flippase family protein [Verrucomicrobiae bacterium]
MRFQSLASKVFWWQQAANVLTFGRSILLMCLISAEGYGTFALASVLLSYFSILRSFDFRAPVVTAPEAHQRLLRTQYAVETGLCLVNIVLFAIATPLLARWYQNSLLLVTGALLLADGVDGCAGTPLYLTERALEFPYLTRLKAMIGYFSFAICLVLAWFGWGAWALAVDRMVVSSLVALCIWRRKVWSPGFAFDRESFRYLLNFGGALFFAGLWGKILFGFDIFLVGTLLGETSAGFYSRAQVFARLPMDLGTGFLGLMALALYAAARRESNEQTYQRYEMMSANIARISMWMAGGIALALDQALPFLLKKKGQEWLPMVPIFWALLPYAVGRPLFQNAAQCITSLHEQRFFLLVVSVLSVIYGALLIWLVKVSILWTAAASGLVLIIGFFWLEHRLHRRLGGTSWRTALMPLLLLAAALALRLGLDRLSLDAAWKMTAIVILGLVYTAAAYGEWRFHCHKKIGLET